MIRIDVTVDDDIIHAIEDTLKVAPGLMKTAYKRNVGRLRSRILARLKVEPKKPTYPLRWKSERQRRAFFATDGFGGGIPSTRSGKLLASYDVQVTDIGDGGVLSITNSDPKARFVIGDDAQPMHLDTGWKQIADVASDARVEAENVLIDTWFLVTDPTAGVPR
jgi:hypothetical protein